MHTNSTVLIVDDDARNIFALRATLKAKGYNTATAQSAEEAFRMLKEDDSIRVVLMDMMPDTDGYEATEQIKADGDLSDVKVIAVTARAMTNDKQRCLDAGADDYISKPIDVDKLLMVLQQHIK